LTREKTIRHCENGPSLVSSSSCNCQLAWDDSPTQWGGQRYLPPSHQSLISHHTELQTETSRRCVYRWVCAR